MRGGPQHHKSGTRIHKIWIKMRERCRDKNHQAYSRYGGRGIRVCKRWEKFVNFLQDMAPTYKVGLQIDREKNWLGYSPKNCRWVTSKTNNQNRRSNVRVKFRGQTLCASEAARRAGLPPHCVLQRIAKGLPPSEWFKPRQRVL